MRHDETIIFENKYGVLTPDLRQMCNDMVERGVTEAAMESTAVYWVPVWNELCESMKLKLVNPYFIKQLPGRKSDVKDAQWIAECLLKNLIKGSFVPEPIVQDMRKLNRRIMDLNEDMTYNCNKLDAAMQRCGFRLSNYVNTIKSKSYQKVLVAIIGGTAHPDELVKMGSSRNGGAWILRKVLNLWHENRRCNMDGCACPRAWTNYLRWCASTEQSYDIWLDEKKKLSDEDYRNPHIVARGYTDYVTIQDYPMRGRPVFLHMRKNKWWDKQTNEIFSYNLELPNEEGTRLSSEFVAFLKDEGGDDSPVD